jgi:hypothetical protein
MMGSEEAFQAFIHERAKYAIGEGSMVGSAVIVFEFISPEGKMGYSLLRPPGASFEDTLDLLTNATETILLSDGDGNGFTYGDEFDF